MTAVDEALPRRISVVIPTRERPALLQRALASVLAQTYRDLEVIVVADGPDPGAEAVAAATDDPRVHIVVRPERGGAPAARNAGIAAAGGQWVALLDDDDEWLPEKLERQVALAERLDDLARPAIVASRLRVVTPRARYDLPRRLPRPGEPLSEYLTLRSGLFHGEGFLQTSTLLAPRSLFRRIPFDETLPRLQELEWALRAAREAGAVLVVAPEALAIWHWDEDRPRLSDAQPWRESLAWAQERRDLFTVRAYGAFCLTALAAMAARGGDWRAIPVLLREARSHGRPSRLDWLAFALIWAVPRSFRFAIRERVMSRGRPTPMEPDLITVGPAS